MRKREQRSNYFKSKVNRLLLIFLLSSFNVMIKKKGWFQELLDRSIKRVTSCVSLVKVTGLFSLFRRMICTNWLLGTSFIMCHLIGKKPLYLSSFQKFMSFLKSTGPSISATPTNCPLALTWFDNEIHLGSKL